MSTASIKTIDINNKNNDQAIDEFEYFEIYKACDHIAYLYDINEIDADFLATESLKEYFKEKDNGKIKLYLDKKNIKDDNTKKNLIKGYIRVLVRNNALNMFRKRNAKYMPKIYTESSLITTDDEGKQVSLFENIASGRDSVDDVFFRDFSRKMEYIFEVLSPKEQELYELLSTTKKDGSSYKHKEACELLSISKEEYIAFVDKLKKILNNVFKINDNNYKEFFS